jgi:hypothetical protein
MDDATFIILLIIGTTFAGGIIKGATNLGLNLLAVPALAPFIGVAGANRAERTAFGTRGAFRVFSSRGSPGCSPERCCLPISTGKFCSSFLADFS